MLKKLFQPGILLALLMLLGGCGYHGGHPRQHKAGSVGSSGTTKQAPSVESDGPPLNDRDVADIPNASPRPEPQSRFGNPAAYEVLGNRYFVMPKAKGYEAQGIASWYGRKFHGQRTSSGEPYDMFGMTAAHRSLPLPTYAKVKNMQNGKEVIVKINDRGPFVKDRLIDLSYAAAKKLGIYSTGTGAVKITAIDPIAWQKQQADASSPKTKQAAKQKTKPKNIDIAVSKKQTVTASTHKQIYLQLGAFERKLNAQKLADKASTFTAALDHVNVRVFPESKTGKQHYKVRVGPLRSPLEAEKLQKKLVALNSGKTPKLVYD